MSFLPSLALILLVAIFCASYISAENVTATTPSMLSSVWNQITNTTSAFQSTDFFATGSTDDTSARLRMQKRRDAVAELQIYIRNLTVAREKVAPVTLDLFGNLTVNVKLFFEAFTVFDVNVARQTLKTIVYIIIRWSDPGLSWNSTDYSGVDEMEMSPDDIWTPRVIIFNAVDIYDLISTAIVISISKNGSVYAIVPLVIETTCGMNLRYFPYDEQLCPIYLYSVSPFLQWDFIEGPDTQGMYTFLKLSSDMDLVNVTHDLVSFKGFQFVHFLLRLKRTTTYYDVFVIFPMVMTLYLNSFVFLIPPGSGEKMSFLVSIFVSTSVFIVFFTDVMPRSLNTIPSVVQLLIAVITESILVLLASIYNLRRFHEDECGTEELPQTGSVKKQKPDKVRKKGIHCSRMCCEGNSRVNILYPTAPVSVSAPDKLEEKEEVVLGAKGKHVPRRLSAQQLDWRCFIAVFVGISVYLLFLLAYALITKTGI